MPRSENIACVDVGFTFTRFAAWSGAQMLGQRRIRTKEMQNLRLQEGMPQRGYWLDCLKTEVSDLRARYSDIDRIAISFPGIVSEEQAISSRTGIWGNARTELRRDELEDWLSLPTSIINDITAAAFRYGTDGAFPAARYILVVSIGSGVGAKLFDRTQGATLLDRGGRAGEIGSAYVSRRPSEANWPYEGLQPILASFSSGVGFAHLMKISAMNGSLYANSILSRRLASEGYDLKSIDRHELNLLAVESIRAGDQFCTGILSQSVYHLARVLQPIILFCSPDIVVLTGGFARSLGEIYRNLVIEHMRPMLKSLYGVDELVAMFKLGHSDDLDNIVGLYEWARSGRS